MKGVGEAGTTGAPPALVNAALDALAPLGVRHLDMPLTPEKLWRAMRDAQKLEWAALPSNFRLWKRARQQQGVSRLEEEVDRLAEEVRRQCGWGG